MGIIGKIKDTSSSVTTILGPWLPQPKIVAAGVTTALASGTVWALGKKGYKIPRKKADQFATALVTLTGTAVTLAGYMKSQGSAEETAEASDG